MKTLAERSWKKVKHALHIGMGKRDYAQSMTDDIKTQTDEAIVDYKLHVAAAEEKPHYWAIIRSPLLLEIQQVYQTADTDKDEQKAINEFLQIVQFTNDKKDILLPEKELDDTEEKMRVSWQHLAGKKAVLDMIFKLDKEQFWKFFDFLPFGSVLSLVAVSNSINEQLSISVDKENQGLFGKVFQTVGLSSTKYTAKDSYIAKRFQQFSEEKLTCEPTALGTNVWAALVGLYLVGQWNDIILKYYLTQIRSIVKQDDILDYFYLLPVYCMIMEDKEYLQRFYNFDERWKKLIAMLDGKQKDYLEKIAIWISSDSKNLSETIIEDYKNPSAKRHFIRALKMLDEQKLLDETDIIKITESYINLDHNQVEAKKNLKETFIIPSIQRGQISINDIFRFYKNAIGNMRTEISGLCIDLIKNVDALKNNSENPAWIKIILEEYLTQPIHNFPFQEMIGLDWGSNNPILLRCLISGLELGVIDFEVVEKMILDDLKLVDELKRDAKKKEIWVNKYANLLHKGEVRSDLARIMLLNDLYPYDNEFHNQMLRWMRENLEIYASMLLEFFNKDMIPVNFYKDWLDFYMKIFKNEEGKKYTPQQEYVFRNTILALSKETEFARNCMDELTPQKIETITNALNMGKLLWFLKEELHQIEYYIKYNLLIRNHYELILEYLNQSTTEVAKATYAVLIRGFYLNHIGDKHWIDLLLTEANANPCINVYLAEFIDEYPEMMNYDQTAKLVQIIKTQLKHTASHQRMLAANEFWLITICLGKNLFNFSDIFPNLLEAARAECIEVWNLLFTEIESGHVKPSQYLEILAIVRDLLRHPSFVRETDIKILVRKVVNAIDAKANKNILTMLNEADIFPMTNEERINILPSMR